MKIFGREPALWAALVASAIQMFSAFVLPMSVEAQGALNALTVAVLGAITAFAVSSERGVPALLAAIKALIAVGLAFGLHWSPELQATVMTFAAAIAAMFIRTQVVAPVAAETPRTDTY
jgi:hypothetical protein